MIIKIITVEYYTGYFDSFDEVKEQIIKILNSTPDTLYSYQAWAEGVSSNIKATIEFNDASKATLEIGSIGTSGVNKDNIKTNKICNYVCFQINDNFHWFRL